jgi:hypothetical protein
VCESESWHLLLYSEYQYYIELYYSLHERPISGTGNVDLVIYAAQLSQSFFSDLAVAVEGFLDLFLVASESQSDLPKDDDMDNSSMLTGAQRNVPPTALAAVVLWCDAELAKFSSAFGGTRILGNLALSPPPRRNSSKRKSSRKGHEEYDDAARERTVRCDLIVAMHRVAVQREQANSPMYLVRTLTTDCY